MKKPNPLEIDIQSAFRNRLRYVAPAVHCVAVPNAGKRGPKAIRQMQREGVSSGFPDLICLWHGGICFIEMKRPTGKLTENQSEWLIRLNQMGFATAVCRSPEEAIAFLRKCGAPMLESRDAA